MKATGVVRRVDDLGRVVIPKVLRRTMGVAEGDPIEMFVDGDLVVMKKYDPECTTLCGSTVIPKQPQKATLGEGTNLVAEGMLLVEILGTKLEQKDTEIEQIEEKWKELLRVRMSVDNTRIWNLEAKLKQQAEEIRKLQEIIESQDNVWMRNMQLAKELEEKLEENKRFSEVLEWRLKMQNE